MRLPQRCLTALLLVPFAAVAVAGCSDDAPTTPASTTTSSATTTGTGGAGGAGEGGAGEGGAGGQPDAGPIGGDRPVEVFVPSSYKEGTAMPLVLLLHGYTASGALQESYFKLKPLAESRGFLYAHPDGTKDAQGKQFWNATDACCDFAPTNVDDAGYLKRVIDDIKARYTVDPKRIYFVGHSNGGFMAHRMACDYADTVAALVSLAGVMVDDLSKCAPSEPVSVLQIHGTADETIAYEGGDIAGHAYPGAVTTVEDWVTLDACLDEPTDGEAIDLETSLAGAETSVKVYDQCAPGGHAELWTVAGGSHVPQLDASFGTRVVDFLLAHPKP